MRLFIAIHLSEEIKSKVEQTIVSLKTANADVKWINKEALHLTLKFLGDTDKSRVKGIIPMLSEIAKASKPFTIITGKLGAFPEIEKPKVLFSGFSSGKDETIALSKKIDEMLVKAAFKREEKPFNPHITLGRCRSVTNISKLSESLLNTVFPEIKQKVEAFYLVKSELVGNTVGYKDLAEFKLKNSSL
ncbi:MAG: 2'-5' RNA ligase [Candidatus Firestonebacteria bacterium RIFOXYC2_FULL_39_67]|nr:MAG: 2'-5' RNA ligase [Candidatus Firestonebacteria bacterium RIFOXYD2_FULL_39_29]OGF53206.1 MAG: 2'-5' RNA ligase [Candidatus Firestonebacteria bacterium RifOxyC12_full_39_7]OGF56951.1 MAG: 2'-5' RNA ligase [Candidatus Firestonebacteria bacterium RIFOXYC2_FULL_39_67]